jgi:hypothetical protein
MCIKTISLHIKEIITNPLLQTLLLTHHYGMRCLHILLEPSVLFNINEFSKEVIKYCIQLLIKLLNLYRIENCTHRFFRRSDYREVIQINTE